MIVLYTVVCLNLEDRPEIFHVSGLFLGEAQANAWAENHRGFHPLVVRTEVVPHWITEPEWVTVAGGVEDWFRRPRVSVDERG